MLTYFLGILTGLSISAAGAWFFTSGPQALREGFLITLGKAIRAIMPFGLTRHYEMKLSMSPVTCDQKKCVISRLDPRHEMIVLNKGASYRFSWKHLLPSALVIFMTSFSKSKGHSILEYGGSTIYSGNLMKIDSNVSIFRLSDVSFTERLCYWGQSS